MIKARGSTVGGNPILVLGLSRNNITSLQEGRPIHITAAELVSMGLPPSMEIMVMAGDTEQSIAASLGMAIDEPQPGQRTRVER